MVVIRLSGGLGNQMFQYAYSKALSLRRDTDFKLDLSAFETYRLHKYCLEFFNIKKKYAHRKDIPRYENLYSDNKYINFLCIKMK